MSGEHGQSAAFLSLHAKQRLLYASVIAAASPFSGVSLHTNGSVSSDTGHPTGQSDVALDTRKAYMELPRNMSPTIVK